MNKVWLVTGSASGLGRNIAEAVLESGDRLVATARDTKRLDDLVKNTALVQFRVFSGSRSGHIGSHIVEFCNVTDR